MTSGERTPRTVTEVLLATARAHPDRDAYVDGGRRCTYAELDRRSGGFAAALAAHGVRPGDVVAITVPSSIEFAVAYLGATRARAVTSAVNQRLGDAERASILARTNPVVTVAPAAAAVPPEAGTVVRIGSEFDTWCEHDPDPALDAAACSAPREEIVAVVWTSGTTGAPKGATYDHAALAANSAGMGDLCRPADRRLVSLPFAHMGYMTRVWDDLANGVTMVLGTEPWSPAEHLRLIEAERITMATGVPTQWTLVLAHPDLATTDLGSLRLAGIGAAAIPPELVHAMREHLGCPVMTRYTSTEAGLISGTRLGDAPDVVAHTVGVASPIVDIRIVAVDDEHDVTAAGEVGEIRVRSAAMFRGYWRDPQRTAEALDADGFLRTGDLGHFGPDGNLRIVGRLKEMYIRGGYNVYPVEIEQALRDHPLVRDAAVVGAPAPVLGEIGVGFVVPADPANLPTLDALREWCRDRLADYKSPDRLVIVPELPVNATHKIDKTRLTTIAKEHV